MRTLEDCPEVRRAIAYAERELALIEAGKGTWDIYASDPPRKPVERDQNFPHPTYGRISEANATPFKYPLILIFGAGKVVRR
ncbi:hypothetical protein WCLP8_4870005 [uncultured Gammaproteobacteria bacterium]